MSIIIMVYHLVFLHRHTGCLFNKELIIGRLKLLGFKLVIMIFRHMLLMRLLLIQGLVCFMLIKIFTILLIKHIFNQIQIVNLMMVLLSVIVYLRNHGLVLNSISKEYEYKYQQQVIRIH